MSTPPRSSALPPNNPLRPSLLNLSSAAAHGQSAYHSLPILLLLPILLALLPPLLQLRLQ